MPLGGSDSLRSELVQHGSQLCGHDCRLPASDSDLWEARGPVDYARLLTETKHMNSRGRNRLHAVVDGTAPMVDLICRRPGCTHPVPYSERGRPRIFCTDSCRKQHARDARRAQAALARATATADQYSLGDSRADGDAGGDEPSCVPLAGTGPGQATPPPSGRALLLELERLTRLADEAEFAGQPMSATTALARLRAAARLDQPNT